MAIEFYDVRKKAKVQVPESNVKKKTYERQTKSGGTSIRYALSAEFEGSKLTKFVSKADFDAMDAPLAD